MSEYIPTIPDLETVAENQTQAIDAAIRHKNYSGAELLAGDLIQTLQKIQRLKFAEEISHETSV